MLSRQAAFSAAGITRKHGCEGRLPDDASDDAGEAGPIIRELSWRQSSASDAPQFCSAATLGRAGLEGAGKFIVPLGLDFDVIRHCLPRGWCVALSPAGPRRARAVAGARPCAPVSGGARRLRSGIAP